MVAWCFPGSVFLFCVIEALTGRGRGGVSREKARMTLIQNSDISLSSHSSLILDSFHNRCLLGQCIHSISSFRINKSDLKARSMYFLFFARSAFQPSFAHLCVECESVRVIHTQLAFDLTHDTLCSEKISLNHLRLCFLTVERREFFHYHTSQYGRTVREAASAMTHLHLTSWMLLIWRISQSSKMCVTVYYHSPLSSSNLMNFVNDGGIQLVAFLMITQLPRGSKSRS